MALTERVEIGQRTILPDGQIQVRTDTVIERDGIEISRTYHRDVVVPGQDVTGRDAKIARIANLEHTPEVVEAYRLKQLLTNDISAADRAGIEAVVADLLTPGVGATVDSDRPSVVAPSVWQRILGVLGLGLVRGG